MAKLGNLGACGCPKGARKIAAGKSGFRCYSNSTNKMVKQVKRKKAGEACWAAPKKRAKRKKK